MWKEIKGFSRYEVSDTGEVRNKETGEIIKQSTSKDGIKSVNFMMNDKGEYKKLYVHRLVAISLVERMNKKANRVRFIDGNKNNITPENLEWCTMRQLLQAEKARKSHDVKPNLKTEENGIRK
jgi:hypothetical protein|nr:MAG TPA: homing endonuclease [Caudoviricetes sp.]